MLEGRYGCYKLTNLVVALLLNFIFLLHEMSMRFQAAPQRRAGADGGFGRKIGTETSDTTL
jgi:hypothetical protein